jgi:hypothetical protein
MEKVLPWNGFAFEINSSDLEISERSKLDDGAIRC